MTEAWDGGLGTWVTVLGTRVLQGPGVPCSSWQPGPLCLCGCPGTVLGLVTLESRFCAGQSMFQEGQGGVDMQQAKPSIRPWLAPLILSQD